MTNPANKPEPEPTGRCSRCDAPLKPHQDVCWLCNSKVEARGHDIAAAENVPIAPPTSSGGFSLASLLLFVTLFSVTLGLGTIAPGLGIALGILLLAVWLRTAAVTRRRSASGLPVSSTEQVQLFFSSLAVTILMLSLVSLAGFAAFWTACLACAGTYFGLEWIDEDVAIPIAYVVCGLVVLIILVVAFKYPVPWAIRMIRDRWQRDTGANENGRAP